MTDQLLTREERVCRACDLLVLVEHAFTELDREGYDLAAGAKLAAENARQLLSR